MSLRHILVSATTAVALGLPGALLAETAADAEAKAAAEMAKDVSTAAEVTQGVADVATEAAADVNAAKGASATDTEAADLASEAANTAAAEVMEAKEVTEEAAKEAKTDADLEDQKKMIQGE